MLDLFQSDEGKQWWKRYGECMNLTFDLNDNSKSLISIKKLFNHERAQSMVTTFIFISSVHHHQFSNDIVKRAFIMMTRKQQPRSIRIQRKPTTLAAVKAQLQARYPNQTFREHISFCEAE